MNVLNVAVHLIAGAISWFAGLLTLAAAFDYFADAVQLFSDPARMMLWGIGVFAVCIVAIIVNFFTMMRDM